MKIREMYNVSEYAILGKAGISHVKFQDLVVSDF